MPRPIATIRWPADTTYNGSYTYHGRSYIDHHQAHARFRLQTNILGDLRDAGEVRYLKVVGIKNRGRRCWAYLNCEEDLAAAAAVYHRSQSERYKQAERQQAPNEEWYLSPRAFQKYVGIGFTTLATWRKDGVPILGGEALETLGFPDGNGEKVPFCSERQAKRIVEAHAASDDALTLANKAAKICRVDHRLVTKLALDGVIDAELRPTRIGSRTFNAWWVSVSDLRQELRRRQARRKPQVITDALSTEEAAQLFDYNRATFCRLVRQGKIKGEYLAGGRRLVVSRDSVLAYQASLDRTLSLSGQENWLRKQQIEVLYPEVNWDQLRPYLYEKRIVPPLKRMILVQVVKRPPGLKSRHKEVRRFWAEHVRVLVEWLRAPKTPAGPRSQSVQDALDFLKTYLADGRFYPRQEIIAAAAKEGISEQSLNAAKPHLKDLAVENDGTRGEGRFTKWKLEKAVVMPGACSTNGRRRRHATDENLSHREKVDTGCEWWEKLEGMHNDILGTRSDVGAVHNAVQKTPQQTAELVQLQIGEVVAAKEKEPSIPMIPRWDEMTATLYWGETAIRKFQSNPAKNQRDLVEAFHLANWASTIPDPFRDAKKLNGTIYDLNKSMGPKAIRFRGDGTGEGVMWEPVN